MTAAQVKPEPGRWAHVGGHKAAKDADHDAGGRDGHGEKHGIPAGHGQGVVGALMAFPFEHPTKGTSR